MTQGLERALGTRRAVAIAIAVTMVIASTSIAIGFLTDDHGFRAMLHAPARYAPAAYDLFGFVPGDRAGNQLRIHSGHLPWWSAADLQIHFLRPLTSLAFAADDRMFGAAPLGYHLVSLAWYLALLIGAAVVFRQVLPAAAATLAVAVFGLSAAHVEAYAWISARHVAIAGALCGAALAVRGGRHGRWLGPLVLAIGLTSSEAALAAVPLWIALELAASRRWRDRVVRCLPVVGLAAAYLAIYGALGYGTRGSEGYHDPSTDPIGFARLAVVRVPLLLGDAALGIPAELAHVVAAWWLAVLGVAAVGVVALGVWWTAPRHPAAGPALEARTLGWLAVGGLGGTVLGAAGYPAGRMLVIPDLAFAAVLGVVLYRGLTARWPGRIVAGTLAIAHLVIAPLAQVRTIDKLAHRADRTDAVADTVVALAPSSGRVFVLAASDPMVFLYPRGILSDRYPGTVRCWSVISAARASHRITRTSERGFTLEPVERTLLDGSFDQLFRAADRPFAIGDTIEQCGATIRVTAVRGGRPSRLDIALRRKLDDPELVWLVWRDHQLARFTFPAIGETTMLPWSPGPSGVL